MSANSVKKTDTANSSTNSTGASEAEVLYQKLGDRWFAFSIIDGEVFMSPVTEEIIQEVRRDSSRSA